MFRENWLKNAFEMRKELCFIDGPIHDEDTKNSYKHRFDYLSREVDPFYSQFLGLDLTVNGLLYSNYPSYEEIVVTPDDSTLSKIVHHQAKFEDFDYDLPDDQNLWKVMSDLNPTNNRQMRISYMRQLPIKSIDDRISNEDIDILSEFLPGREEFEWFSDVVLNLEFKEKVQIQTDEDSQIDVEDKLNWLFGVFGFNFVYKFFHDEANRCYGVVNEEKATMFVSDEELPMKQITISTVEEEDRFVLASMECSYEALCRFLIEDRHERGIDEVLGI